MQSSLRTQIGPVTSAGALRPSTYLMYRLGVAVFEALFGVVVLVLAVDELDVWAIFGVACVMFATSVWLWRWRGWTDQASRLAALFMFDLIALSVFLGLTGGPSNPFSVLYLVQVTLASMLFHGRFVWVMTCSASLLYGVLFWLHDPLPAVLGGHDMGMSNEHAHHAHQKQSSGGHGEQSAFSAHLQGMWLAFTMTALLLTGLVSRVAMALREEQEKSIKTSRLLGLTTLAAGAAHELGGPLATIKIAAGEMRHLLVHEGPVEEMIEETQVIDDELGRARRILDRMMLDAGQLKGEGLEAMTVEHFVQMLSEALEEPVRKDLSESCRSVQVLWPVEAITTSVEQLLKNAREARATKIEVMVRCTRAHEVIIEVLDNGEGLTSQTRARSGEPFFTTKETGSGMGLGIFLARSLCEQLAGSLVLEDRGDGVSGCLVTMRLGTGRGARREGG